MTELVIAGMVRGPECGADTHVWYRVRLNADDLRRLRHAHSRIREIEDVHAVEIWAHGRIESLQGPPDPESVDLVLGEGDLAEERETWIEDSEGDAEPAGNGIECECVKIDGGGGVTWSWMPRRASWRCECETDTVGLDEIETALKRKEGGDADQTQTG